MMAARSGGSVSSLKSRAIAPSSALFALILAAAGCGSGGSANSPTPSDEPIFSSPLADPPAIDDTFVVGDQREVALECWGEGSPTIVLEAGTDSSGIDQFGPNLIPQLEELAMTCTYDRLGTGGLSDPAPNHRRTLDDLVEVLHDLLEVADVPGPVLLVGQSGGGGIVVHYAGRYPDEVAGLVLLDVTSAAADLEFAPDEPEWDNPEHVDWFAGGRLLAKHRLPLHKIPVRIVTATEGQSSVKDQSYWLELSPLASQTTLEGGHDIHEDNPDGVVAEIKATLAAVEG
jgi:pimeloyl-ACP methyl ester carboxylesterase